MADTYIDTEVASYQVTYLMRRINALEASVGGGGTPVFDRKWGSHGLDDGEFDQAIGVCVFADEVYVVDQDNHRIQVFGLDGTYLRQWGSFGTGDGQFNQPSGIYVYNDEVYVADTLNHRVQVFDTTGVFQRKWGSPGSSDGQFSVSIDIAVLNDEVYVTDRNNERVQVFTIAGAYDRKWGTLGSGDGQFASNSVNGICALGSEIYVVDTGNDRVQVFDTDGVFQRKFGSAGSGDGQFDFAVAIRGYGNELFVLDAVLDRFQIFSTAGVFQQKFGSTGTGTGEFSSPYGVFVYGNKIFIAELVNDRVQVFDYAASGIPQTEFFSYTETVKTSLGTPDGGVSVPDYNALYANEADSIWEHITDMRAAIETMAPYFTNALTGNAFNWTDASPDNLYYNAMGDRSDYGATGGPRYDWTRPTYPASDDYGYSIDIGELDETISLLEAS